MNEINLGDVFLGFILTWGIGLAPPVLIRWVLLKRPMEKWPAIGICCLFWLVNVILFTALGSQSKTHAALVLVAYVSYLLLRRPSRKTEEIVRAESVPETMVASDPTACRPPSADSHRRHLGWIRLGVVISAAWTFGVSGYALYDFRALRSELAAEIATKPWLADPVADREWEIVGQQSFLTDCKVAEADVICSPRLANLALQAFAPILGFWVLCIAIFRSALWVRAGFRSGT